MKPTHLQLDILSRGVADYIGLWELIRIIRRRVPTIDDHTIRDIVLIIVDDLLVRGWVEPVDLLAAGKCTPWSISIDTATDRIQSEWDALAGEPTIGDIVWFQLTPEGTRVYNEREQSVGPP